MNHPIKPPLVIVLLISVSLPAKSDLSPRATPYVPPAENAGKGW